jgi:hypothetical protein
MIEDNKCVDNHNFYNQISVCVYWVDDKQLDSTSQGLLRVALQFGGLEGPASSTGAGLPTDSPMSLAKLRTWTRHAAGTQGLGQQKSVINYNDRN